MALAVPACWSGLRSVDWYRHRAERKDWYKVELLDGVLVLTLRTRRVRALIDRLTATLAEALPPGHVVTSDRGSLAGAPGDGTLRRQGAVHEAAVSALRADIHAQLERSGRRDLAVLLGAGWQPVREGPLWWTDVCVVPWVALTDPVDRSGLWASSPPPVLIVEVSEPATAALDRGERAAAYAAGGCAWLVVVDPADAMLQRRSSRLELYDLRGGKVRRVDCVTDRLELDDPASLCLDLSGMSEFASAALDAAVQHDL